MGVAHVFVDYDGTVTDVDTFDVLVQRFAGEHEWARLEEQLHAGTMSLREVLAAQAHFVRGSIEDADALLAKSTGIDPSFGAFAERCRFEGAELTIVSSGVTPLITRALERNGLGGIAVLANDVSTEAEGWVMHFRDDSPNGHDKAAAVRRAKTQGSVAYAGDGYSDYDAALAADVRFAKRGRSLERFLRAKGVPLTPFDRFAEVADALFGER